MTISYSDEFQDELDEILIFIANDNIKRAIAFWDDLRDKINKIPDMPYRFRENQKFKMNELRELIFKGYVIPFIVEKKNIKILGIFKQNKHAYSNT